MARQEFWNRLDRARDCWLWTGAKDPKGYGVVSVDGRLWKAHRYAWRLVNGRELPAGSRISQLCGNTACCNPEHLLSASGSRSPGRAKRASGTGSLVERQPGVWELRVSLGKSAKTGAYDRATRTFYGNSTQAHKALAALVGEAAAGQVKAGSETMDGLFDAWLRHLQRVGRSPNYITGARRKIGRNLRPVMGRKPPKKVTVAFVDQVLADLGAPGRPGGRLSPATIRQHKQILSSVFSYAWKRDMVASNPVHKVDTESVAPTPIVEPTIAEVIALMKAAEAVPERRSKYGRAQHRPEMSTAIWLGAVLGIRQAELCALKLDDVDRDKRRVRIDESIYVDEEQGTGLHTKDTKSHKVRYVALDPVSTQVISEQLQWMKDRADLAGTGFVQNPYLFSDAVDGATPWRPIYVSRWFAVARQRCNGAVRREVHFHCLRHFHSTHALDLGYPITAIAGRNGHDPSVLLKVYSHHLEQTDRRISEAVAALVRIPQRRTRQRSAASSPVST
jgi:integrase